MNEFSIFRDQRERLFIFDISCKPCDMATLTHWSHWSLDVYTSPIGQSYEES